MRINETAARSGLTQDTIRFYEKSGCWHSSAAIRSPLAIGVLGGKYDANTTFSPHKIRGNERGWQTYFKDGKITDRHISQLSAVRETLTSGGRTLA